MKVMMCAIQFSDGLYGPLVPEEQALRAFEKIPEHRRALCRVTYWSEVLPEDMDTRPPPADMEAAIDPFGHRKPEPRILRNRARCRHCDETIESKHRHDFVSCSCEQLSVDGGRDYLKRGYGAAGFEELSEYDSTDSPASSEARAEQITLVEEK